jgi:predicted ATPase
MLALMSEHNGSGPSLLLSFSAENVGPFLEPFELSLRATPLSDTRVVRHLARTLDGAGVDALPVAGVFGANASGKTSVLRAIDHMRWLVISSFREPPGRGARRTPFRLAPDASSLPTSYRIELVLNGVEHHYVVEVDGHRVVYEAASWFPHGRPARLFEREGQSVVYGSGGVGVGRAVERILREDALFLSAAAAAGHVGLMPLYGWFQRNLILMEERSRNSRQLYTTSLLTDPELGAQAQELLRAADLGIRDARVVEMDDDTRALMARVIHILRGEEGELAEVAAQMPTEVGVKLTHIGPAGAAVELDQAEESQGTLVWLGVVGPVLEALRDGNVLLADELDASLHSELVRQLVALFQDPETNPNRAQLVFNSHDTTLLPNGRAGGVLGRDQVWFAEKLKDGRSRLTPLADYSPRKDHAVRDRYLSGRYGAVPQADVETFATVGPEAG